MIKTTGVKHKVNYGGQWRYDLPFNFENLITSYRTTIPKSISDLRFSVSYNVFDGVELLEDSISHISSFVDHISVVFQTKSYWGNELSQREINIVYELIENNIIDDLYLFDNDFNIPVQQNEINKRNIGIEIGKYRNCSHYMTIDCDEFYIPSEFETLVNFHRENPEMVSYLPLVGYYKDTKYLIDSNTYLDGDLYVSGFFPTKYKFLMDYPLNIKVDPSRKVGVEENKINIFNKEQIKMHHLSYVRANILQKVNNSLAKMGYGDKQDFFKKLNSCYENFEKDGVAMSAYGVEYDIIEIDPYIQLNKYYKLKQIDKL